MYITELDIEEIPRAGGPDVGRDAYIHRTYRIHDPRTSTGYYAPVHVPPGRKLKQPFLRREPDQAVRSRPSSVLCYLAIAKRGHTSSDDHAHHAATLTAAPCMISTRRRRPPSSRSQDRSGSNLVDAALRREQVELRGVSLVCRPPRRACRGQRCAS